MGRWGPETWEVENGCQKGERMTRFEALRFEALWLVVAVAVVAAVWTWVLATIGDTPGRAYEVGWG